MFNTALGGALEIGGAIVGAYAGGLLGLCLGWVLATTVEAVYMFPMVYKVLWPARGTVEEPLSENVGEMEPVWLFDTVIMTAIPPRHTTGYLRAVTNQLRAVSVPPSVPLEPAWLSDTVMQPAITPSRSTFIEAPTIPLLAEEQMKKALPSHEAGISPVKSFEVTGKPRMRKLRLKKEKEM
jgi:hypothetical protein